MIEPRRLYTSRASVQLVLRTGFRVRLLSHSGDVGVVSFGLGTGAASGITSSTLSVVSRITSSISLGTRSSRRRARLRRLKSRPLTISFPSLMRSVDKEDRISSDEVYASISCFVAAVRALVAVKGHLKPWVLLSAWTDALRQLGLDFKEVFLGAGLLGWEVEGLLGSRVMNRERAQARRSIKASGYCCEYYMFITSMYLLRTKESVQDCKYLPKA